MRQLSHFLPTLPAIAAPPKTYAAWPVWSDSTTAEVRFVPLPKKAAVKLWHRARDFERQTRQANRQDGALGRNGLAVLHALIFDFLNYVSGRLDPGHAAIARMAAISKRSVARGLDKLRAAGVLNWLRRCRESRDKRGRFHLEQETNAYAILPVTQWKGYRAPPEAPPAPEPGTWGDHPPLADSFTQAAQERLVDAPRTVLSLLEAEPGNVLARAWARFGRSMIERDLLDCQPGDQISPEVSKHNGIR